MVFIKRSILFCIYALLCSVLTSKSGQDVITLCFDHPSDVKAQELLQRIESKNCSDEDIALFLALMKPYQIADNANDVFALEATIEDSQDFPTTCAIVQQLYAQKQ